ncbi:MAG: AraC family transcriptional regulator [Thermomicrobiales bacterium]
MRVQRLLWQNLAARGAYHAALVSSRVRARTNLHTHDFFEMMYVLDGRGTHEINGRSLPLAPGDLYFIRPDDHHAIAARVADGLHFVNIAFPAETWDGFRVLVGLTNDALGARSSAPPPAVRVPAARRDECTRNFRRALLASHEQPSRLELVAFWTLALPFLLEPASLADEDDRSLPPWLRTACWAMRDEENLRLGLPRLVELSGVSPAHLARTLKAGRGQTPTAFVNDLRLERAALLLRTTTRQITEIAAECGFESLSYFYRVFGRRFGVPPRAYRLQARRAVVP